MTDSDLQSHIASLDLEILHLRAEVQTLNRLYSILSEKYTALLQWQSARMEAEAVEQRAKGTDSSISSPKEGTHPRQEQKNTEQN